MSGYTVGELRQALALYDDDHEVLCGGGLTINGISSWGEDALIEFNEIQAELSPAFKRKHPTVLVAFARFESDGSVIQMTTVPQL